MKKALLGIGIGVLAAALIIKAVNSDCCCSKKKNIDNNKKEDNDKPINVDADGTIDLDAQ